MTVALNASTLPLSLSLLTATKGNASKRLIPDATGAPIRDPEHRLGISAGRIEHVQVAGLAGLADLLQRITPQQALVHGIPIGSAPGEVFELVVADKFRGAPGTIARTKGCIQYPPGPRLLMLDRDPEPGAEPLAHPADVMTHIGRIFPGFAAAGWLATVSTSSAIRDKQSRDWRRPPDGWHIYLVVTGDVERFREILMVRLWIAGYGFCKLARQNRQTGVCAVLERTLVDLAVFSPERLDYVAGALIAPSATFYQSRPPPELHPGLVLALDSLPAITTSERAQYATLVAKAQERLTPERRARVREVVKAALGGPVHSAFSGAEIEREVTARLALAARGALRHEHPLYFCTGGSMTAGELNGPEGQRRDGHRLADPQEPTYRQGDDAVLHWRQGDWRIVSWAHGVKKVYRLAHDWRVCARPWTGRLATIPAKEVRAWY